MNKIMKRSMLVLLMMLVVWSFTPWLGELYGGAGDSILYAAEGIAAPTMTKVAVGPASAQKKGKANNKSFTVNKDPNSVTYSYSPFRISKISLSGNTYTITGYVVNNRIFKMKWY